MTNVESAISEILHTDKLDEAPGLQPLFLAVELVRHRGTSEDELLEGPIVIRDL